MRGTRGALYNRRMKTAALLLAFAAGAASAQAPAPLADVLGCADFDTLARPVLWHEGAAAQLADCKSLRREGSAELECRPRGKLDVLGLAASEFSLRESSDGSHTAHTVFKAGIDRVRAAAEKRHGSVFEPEGADGYVMRLPGSGERRLELGQREDGASELACIAAGPQAADATRAGADATHGALRGRVTFPTRPIPPMRVCAVPVGAARGGWCALTGEDIPGFTIGAIPPGEYYVLAWPERDNPNGFVVAYARALERCAPNQPGCAGGILERVYIRARQVRDGVDLTRTFTDLPPHLARPPDMR